MDKTGKTFYNEIWPLLGLNRRTEPIEVDRFREAPLERGQVTNISERGAWTISPWIKNPMYTYSTFSWSSEKVRKTSLNCGGFKN